MSASSHRIILLNFTEAEANAVAKAGYKVDRGIIGSPDREGKYCPFQVPHPLYEYDVLVLFYNSQLSRSPELQSQLTNPINLFRETGSFDALRDLNLHPRVRVAFTGGDTGMPHLTLGGIPFAKLIDAERDVSAFVEHKGYTFSIEKLHRLIVGFRNQIAGVSQFFSVPQNNYPFSHETVLTSRIGQQVAGYGTTYENETFPRYVILPQLKDFSRAIIEILQCLESVWPQLFPDRVQQGWINAAEFLLPEEKAIEAEIQEVIAVATHAVEEKRKNLAKLTEENSFIRDLLTALENDPDPSKRLSAVVTKALRFLEFEVDDIDEKIKSAIKKEDLWVREGNFLAITEVTGTVNKNPKTKEFNDIFARMATIYKRQNELPLPSGANISGLLVLNYDVGVPVSDEPHHYPETIEFALAIKHIVPPLPIPDFLLAAGITLQAEIGNVAARSSEVLPAMETERHVVDVKLWEKVVNVCVVPD